GACVFTDKWSLDELAYGVPRDGPYQTNTPSPDDIISERLKRIVVREEVVTPPSSSAFDQPSSSHLNDDDDDGNDEGTSCANTPSPTRFVNSLTNEVPRVFQNPPNIDPDMEPFYTHQTEIINRQVQLRDEHRGGLRSIGKGLRNLWRNMKNDEDVTTTLSPITTSFSPSPPNALSKTPSTKDTSSTFGTISPSFELKPQSSPLTSNDTPSPQPSNPFLENVMDAPL
ncbi:hypothetical protein Tco_1026319, partial [Tanacetum coccineum]